MSKDDTTTTATGCVGLCVLFAAVLLWLRVCDSDSMDTRAPAAPDKVEAWVMAQEFVKDRLSSPGTASFGSLFGDYQDADAVVTDLGSGVFRVDAWVDAENAFGATLRQNFACSLQHTGENNWRLLWLEFEE